MKSLFDYAPVSKGVGHTKHFIFGGFIVKLFVLLMFFLCFIVVSITGAPLGELATDPAIVTASWYGAYFEGRPMANGKPFKAADPTTAAHKSLPFGTKLLVKNPATGRSLVVTVKDRGPYVKGRDLDLSRAAARKLGYARRGLANLVILARR